MIRWSNLLHLLGFFTLGLSVGLLTCVCFALANGDEGLTPLAASLAVGVIAGVLLILVFRLHFRALSRREGLLLVVATWLIAALLGALPFYFSPHFPSFTDSVFESVSGFSTTGATVLADVEALPASLLLWRSLTHWLGGMGIILLGIAILPLIGAGGRELYRAEFSGARSERLRPRIAETALALWKIYIAFTLAGYAALRLAGMGKFDALCHAFSTLATGGFSTRNGSIEAYGNPVLEIVIVVFMVLAGINFTRHYRLLVERRVSSFWGDVELRLYLIVIGVMTAAMSATLLQASEYSLGESLRLASFQVVSILTTTGFSSADFQGWSSFAQLLLLVLMFVGGCTGSTAGGMKVARIGVLFRVVGREFHQLVEPHGVFAVRFGRRAIPEKTIRSLLNLVYLAFLVNFVACICLAALGMDVLTTISAVAACMFNIGPGLGQVGPAENYGGLPAAAKWVLSICMLAGRLEFYTLLVLFTRPFWRM